MCGDCCFNLAATLAAAALIIAGRQESWRGPHLVHRSLAISTAPRKEPANSRGSVAENYSLHMPARKAAAAARWGPVLCEEDRGIGRTFQCIMLVWRQKNGVCVCVYVSICACVNVCVCSSTCVQV